MQYKIIVDRQSRTNPTAEKKEYIIDIEELRCKGDVYDSIVITKSEDYVIRRLELTEYHVLNVLPEPIKQPLPDLNIELFEGNNYIYLIDMTGNRFYAEYIIKNDFTDLYVTHLQMQSVIAQTESSILESVSANLDSLDKTITAKLELKVNTKDLISEINASADVISLEAGRLIINSGNFKLNELGNITATGGTIGGFTLGDTEFIGNLNGIYNYNSYDLRYCMSVVMDFITPDLALTDIYDFNSDNKIDSFDFYRIRQILLGEFTNTKNVSGTLKINSKDPKNCFTITKNGEIVTSLGVAGIDTKLLGAENIVCSKISNDDRESFNGVLINGAKSTIQFVLNGNQGTHITYEEVASANINNYSLEKIKKIITLFTKTATEIIKNGDIYEYNFKTEKDTDKKHIGFVIGKKYKTPNEVISADGKGIEAYSQRSIMWKAMQEIIKRVEKLEELK